MILTRASSMPDMEASGRSNTRNAAKFAVQEATMIIANPAHTMPSTRALKLRGVPADHNSLKVTRTENFSCCSKCTLKSSTSMVLFPYSSHTVISRNPQTLHFSRILHIASRSVCYWNLSFKYLQFLKCVQLLALAKPVFRASSKRNTQHKYNCLLENMELTDP